jgi:acyl dehydratase
MFVLQTPQELLDLVGSKLGVSDWFTIEQEHLDCFARVTGDDNWIHVDTERALREMPGGKTIAHGLFTLSLVPVLQRDIFRIERRGKGINYGSDRVRYTAPVPVGSRVRLHQTLMSAARVGAATRFKSHCEIEIEFSNRPALIAEFIVLIHDE